MSVEVRGGDELARLGRRLKQAGAGELRRELLREIRKTVKPTVAKIPAEARDILPRRGGLADIYAGHKISVRSNLSERRASVMILSNSPGRLRDVNNGRLRHPLFGDRSQWFPQRVPIGWFSQPIREDAPRIQLAVRRVMSDISSKISRSTK